MKTWTVRISVSDNRIEDGFELTNDSVNNMLLEALPFAESHEVKATVIQESSSTTLKRLELKVKALEQSIINKELEMTALITNNL